MQRIDTATKAVDLFGAGKHGYKNGNRALGILPTDFNAVSLNNLQEEICRVIEAAGIALDGTVFDQLLTALRSAGVFATQLASDNSTKVATTAWIKLGFEVSFATNGYLKLPDIFGGWIAQWGLPSIVNANANTFYNFNYTIPFPNLCNAIVGSNINTNAAVTAGTNIDKVDAIQGRVSWSQGVTGGGSLAIFYIAFGR